MQPRENTLNRRIRSAGGKFLRRFGMLPGGMPDGLGDDESLRGTTLSGDVILYFPDTADSLYQLRGWYGPLRELHRAQGLTIICMDSRVAATIRGEIDVPVVTVAQDATLDALISSSGTKLILYVNYNPLNMAPLRARSALHVSLLHGDSDKGVSVSNQVKAYDYSFVAGQAAIDRFARYTSLFDAASRCIAVGRPALDTDRAQVSSSSQRGDQPVVLYAPTWEGGQASVAYSSLRTHADPMLRSLLAAGYRVIYRPHPLTGVRVPEFGEADRAVRDLLEGGWHTISDNRPLQLDFVESDLLICDVSAVANDWLATGKPAIVTRSAGPEAQDAATRMLEVLPRLDAADAETAAELVAEQLEVDPHREERRLLTEYYLGDTTPGASLERFLAACRDLSAQRDALWSRIEGSDGMGHLPRVD
ncbi:MAG: CDP-glycerol glycerophosphotransferase family protein [Brachybacterium alimentarium]